MEKKKEGKTVQKGADVKSTPQSKIKFLADVQGNAVFKPTSRAATRHPDCNLRSKVNPPSRC